MTLDTLAVAELKTAIAQVRQARNDASRDEKARLRADVVDCINELEFVLENWNTAPCDVCGVISPYGGLCERCSHPRRFGR